MTKRIDMHRADIVAAIRKTGWTMQDLMREAGLSKSAGTRALTQPWPRVQAVIASHLKMRAQDIWPSRYGPDGQPRKGLLARKSNHTPAKRRRNSPK